MWWKYAPIETKTLNIRRHKLTDILKTNFTTSFSLYIHWVWVKSFGCLLKKSVLNVPWPFKYTQIKAYIKYSVYKIKFTYLDVFACGITVDWWVRPYLSKSDPRRHTGTNPKDPGYSEGCTLITYNLLLETLSHMKLGKRWKIYRI